MRATSHLIHAFACFLPFGATLSLQGLGERDNGEVYSYTKLGTTHVQNIATYHTTSTRPCTVTKTSWGTTTRWTDPGSIFTTTITTTTTKIAQTPYTSTITASAGFIPIDDSVPGASYDPAASLAKREALATSPARPRLASDSGSANRYKHGYPQSVEVVHWQQGTNCQQETATAISTQINCRGRASRTVTSTVTSTTTQYPSTAAPVYGACQANNLATSYKGMPLSGLRAETLAVNATTGLPDDPPGYTYTLTSDQSTGYDCCVAAIMSSPPAAFWGLGQDVGNTDPADDTQCIITYLTGCQAPQRNSRSVYRTDTFEIRAGYRDDGKTGYTDGRVFTAGNAYCGQWFRGCIIGADGSEDCSPPKPAT